MTARFFRIWVRVVMNEEYRVFRSVVLEFKA